MKMRRTIALCLTLAICASLAIGGTMAYLQDTDSDVNVMTLGSVYIDQKEYERVNDSALNLNDSNLKDFVFDDPSQQNPHPLFPAIGDLTEEQGIAWRGDENNPMTLWTNANVQDKFVTVENTGRSEAFVRTLFAVEAPANVAHPLVLNWNEDSEWDITTDPVLTVSLTKEGVTGTYDIYVATFNDVMAPKYESLPSLLQVALPCEAGNKDVEAYGDRLEIYVLTQAMQVNGFDTAALAFTAGFGDVTADNVQTWFEGITPPTNTETGDEADLKAVLAAATAGEPAYITLTGNVTYETADHHDEDDITPASRVVIDGQGKYTITFKGSGVTPFGDTEAPITLKNLTVVDESVSYNESAWELLYLEMGGPELICENVDFTEARISPSSENAKFINCSFKGHPNEYCVWMYNGNAQFINCSFTGERGLKICDRYAGEVNSVLVDGCTFEITAKPGIAIDDYDEKDMKVSIINSTFRNCQPGDQGLYIYETDNTVPVELKNNIVVNEVVIPVATAEEFKNVLTDAGAAGAGNTIISLTADLDMSSMNWTPVNVDGYHGADIVTLDGNDHTITGLKAPLFAGGFAGGSGIVIKDLTIEDSDIVSTNTIGSGAFIDSVDSMARIDLINCHLKNSTVTGGSGSRTGGLLGWTAGYNNVNDGPVKTYVTIKNCSVINCEITCDGSVGGIYGHAGNNAWTYSTVEDCIVKNCKLNSTDDGGWRVGVVVGTANVGEMTIKNIEESGNTLTQTGKTAPAGQSNLYGRFVPGSTGKLFINGVEIN